MPKKTLPGLGQNPSNEQIAEALGTLAGERGENIDRAVTFRDLIENGTIESTEGISLANADAGDATQPTNPAPPSTIPPAPENLTASGAFESVILEWRPPGEIYGNHSLTEVWRNETDDLGSATHVESSTSMVAANNIGGGQTRYYWIRFVSIAGIAGPFNDTAGTKAQTAESPDYLRNELVGQIRSTELHGELKDTINTTIRQQAEPLYRPDGSDLYPGDRWQEVDANDELVDEHVWNGLAWGASGLTPKALLGEEIDGAKSYTDDQIVEQVGVCRDGANTIQTAFETQATCEAAGYIWDDTISLAQRVETVGASAQSAQDSANINASAIQEEQTARADGDSALANDISTLSSAVDDNAGAIQTEQNARADADSALAEDISTVSASASDAQQAADSAQDAADSAQNTADTNTASITQEASVRADADGTLARHSVHLDANGYVGGYGIEVANPDDGDPTSEFLIHADTFAVGLPEQSESYDSDSTLNYPFAIGTVDGRSVVTIKNTAIEDASITDAKIGYVNAEKIRTPSLSAVSANIGVATAGTVRSGSGQFRIDLNQERQRVYDDNGTLRVQIGRLD